MFVLHHITVFKISHNKKVCRSDEACLVLLSKAASTMVYWGQVGKWSTKVSRQDIYFCIAQYHNNS